MWKKINLHSINSRMFLGLGSLALLFLIVLWLVMALLSRQQQASKELNAIYNQAATWGNVLRSGVNQSTSHLQNFLLQADASYLAQQDKVWKNQIKEAKDSLEALSDRWEDSYLNRNYAEILSLVEELEEQQKPFSNKGGQGNEEQTWVEWENNYLPVWNRFNGKLAEWRIYLRDQVEAKELAIQAMQVRFQWLMALIAAFAVIVCAVVYWLLRRQFLAAFYLMVHQVKRLAGGDLIKEKIYPKDESGVVLQEIYTLNDNLKEVREFAMLVGEGKFDNNIVVFEGQGELGKSLINMRDSLKKVSEEQEKNNWNVNGFTKIGSILRRNTDDLEKLCASVLSNLIAYVGANQGGLFVVNDDDEEVKLELKACYAYDRQKFIEKKIAVGQGLVGQCYLEKEPIHLKEVPAEYLQIGSGLGETKARNLFIVPLIFNDKPYGVLEVASFKEFTENDRFFLTNIARNIASSISTVKINERTKRLLEESQQMTEEMRAQEEEMRQNMEELEATQEEMRRSQGTMTKQQENLSALVNNTEDSIITIDKNYKVVLINNALKKRYKGTPYENIGPGTQVLETLDPSIREEWKSYYDRALAGEHFNYILESSVQGEKAFRQYFLNPMRDQEGSINGVSVFSRDVSQEKRAEVQVAQLQKEIEALQKESASSPEKASTVSNASSVDQERKAKLMEKLKSNDRKLKKQLNKGN